MTGSPIGDALQRELRDAGHDAADAMRRLTHPHLFRRDQPTPPAQNPATEDNMQLWDEIKDHAVSIAEKVAQVDTAMIDRAEKIGAIPGAAEFVDALLSAGHVPPSLITAFTGLAKEVALLAPQPQADPVAAAIAADAQAQTGA